MRLFPLFLFEQYPACMAWYGGPPQDLLHWRQIALLYTKDEIGYALSSRLVVENADATLWFGMLIRPKYLESYA